MQLTKQQERLLCLALDILTPEQIFLIAERLSDVQRAGYGELRIIVEKGRFRFLRSMMSEDVEQLKQV